MKNLAFIPFEQRVDYDELSSTREYIFDFLQMPHPHRPGEMCPIVSKLIDQKTLFVGISNDFTEAQIQDSINTALLHQMSIIQELSSTLIVFTEDSIWKKLNKLHVENLLTVLDHGFVLGVFGPESNVPSVHDKNFFPSRSPKNMLVIRTLVPHDLQFFTNIQSKRRRLFAYQAFAKKFPHNEEVRRLLKTLQSRKLLGIF